MYSLQDQPAHVNSTSVTQNTEVNTVPDKDTNMHPALDDDGLTVEPVVNAEECIQDLEKAPGELQPCSGQVVRPHDLQ